MDDDLEELREIFLDECQENIELLERGLMRMDEGDGDLDCLNEVFRAAHSIKGGGATFGYMSMAELTHHMETLLDEMRSGRREVEQPDVDLLLQGLDLVQAMLADSRNSGDSADNPDRLPLQEKLEKSVVTAGSAPATEAGDTGEDVQTPVQSREPPLHKWNVEFKPNTNFFVRGNNPVATIRAVKYLGELSAELDESQLPDWKDFDVDNCNLGWTLRLTSACEEADILEIFDWIDIDCTFSVEKVGEAEAVVCASEPEPSVAKVEPSPAAKSDSTFDKEEQKVSATSDKNVKAKAGGGGSSNESSSIRIATDKIDQLINLVGELVITQSMLSRVCNTNDEINLNELRERMSDLEHNTRDLQESVMQVRMLPISSAFSRLPRLVRDLSRKLDKEVDLVLLGGETELDKTVLERMIDPLVHLVRNGLDHGLETPAERAAAGKTGAGKLTLEARQESGSVVIEISDDGKGINGPFILGKAREKGIVGEDEDLTDDQINQLIFAPGFSTAAVVSDVSGRGVGMDVVRRNIMDLGGRVHVQSTFGKGTRILINLPLSLAILDGQLVDVAGQTYVIPVLSIIETLELAQTETAEVPGTGEICMFRGEYIQMLRVAEHFRLPEPGCGRLVVVIDTHGKRIGLVIDDVLGQQQVVIKPLDRNYRSVKGLAGATIMSDGSVALILDPANFTEKEAMAEAA